MPKEGSDREQYPENFEGYSGGNLHANTYNKEGYQDGFAAFTSLGEFACRFPDFGGMLAQFPERGLIFHYDDEGVLDMVSLSITSYLFDLVNGKQKDKLSSMANEGRDLSVIADFLMENQILIAVNLDLKGRNFSATQVEEGVDEITLAEVENADFRRGLVGELDLGEGLMLKIQILDYGDDLFLGLGEVGTGKNKYIGVEVSHKVGYEEQILGQLMDDYNEEEDGVGDLDWAKKPENKKTPDVELNPRRFEVLAKNVLIAESVIV